VRFFITKPSGRQARNRRSGAARPDGSKYGRGLRFEPLEGRRLLSGVAAAPTVTGVSSPATGAYAAGTAVPITVAFSKAVTVTGLPQLALNDGGAAGYTSGSGTAALTFTYSVAVGRSTTDLDYASTAALALNGGSIHDATGNAAALTLPPTGTDGLAMQNILIDTTSPTVTIGRAASQDAAADGSKIHFVAVVDEPVTDFTSASVLLGGTATGSLAATVKLVSAGGLDGYFALYEVTVTGMTGSGAVTATVPAGRLHDLAGDANLASTGSDNTVTYEYPPPMPSVRAPVNVDIPAGNANNPPTVASVQPNNGSLLGGTTVTIFGTNLSDPLAVMFGTTPATDVVVDSDTRITAESPAGAGAAVITVTTAAGASSLSPADWFFYGYTPSGPQRPFIPGHPGIPIVSKVSPSAGPPAGGSVVTIVGKNLADATAVTFGLARGTILSNSGTQIIARSPAGTGTVDITVTTARGTSNSSASDRFYYSLGSADPQTSFLPA
jgi:hypothetical protein